MSVNCAINLAISKKSFSLSTLNSAKKSQKYFLHQNNFIITVVIKMSELGIQIDARDVVNYISSSDNNDLWIYYLKGRLFMNGVITTIESSLEL